MFRWFQRLWARSNTQRRIDVLEERVVILQGMIEALNDRLIRHHHPK